MLKFLTIHRCKSRIPAFTLAVDLDADKPPRKFPRKGGPDITRVQMRESASIRMAIVGAYLDKKVPFDASLLNAISKFLGTKSRSSANSLQT